MAYIPGQNSATDANNAIKDDLLRHDTLTGVTTSAVLDRSGINAAQGAYNDARNLANSANFAISASRGDAARLTNVGLEAQGLSHEVGKSYQEARDTAAMASGDISNVRLAASNVLGQAGELRPYAETLSRYGDTIWDDAGKVVGGGLNSISVANSLLGLDPNAGGLAGEWGRLYRMLSGDNQVSMAAHDVQSSFQNAGGQALRDASRRGVSSGSGAMGALRQQFSRAMAVALAAAKTQARKSAIGEQSNMLGTITDKANSLLQGGANVYNAGLVGQKAAADAKQSAAGIEKTIADIYNTGGSLYGDAAKLQIAQADTFRQIQSSEDSARIGYLNVATDAFGKSGSIQASAASAYSGIINALANAAGGVVSATNAYNSSKASMRNAEVGAVASMNNARTQAEGEFLSTLAKRNDYGSRTFGFEGYFWTPGSMAN